MSKECDKYRSNTRWVGTDKDLSVKTKHNRSRPWPKHAAPPAYTVGCSMFIDQRLFVNKRKHLVYLFRFLGKWSKNTCWSSINNFSWVSCKVFKCCECVHKKEIYLYIICSVTSLANRCTFTEFDIFGIATHELSLAHCLLYSNDRL